MTSTIDIVRGKWGAVLLWVLVLPILYAVHLYNHTLSHDIAEFFSVIVACAIFLFAWNARFFLNNHYYLFLGIAFLFVGLLDFTHAMSYEGVLGGAENNLPGQLWYAARYVQAISLLIAPLFTVRKLRRGYVIGAYGLVTLFLLGTIFFWNLFPATYIEGVGVTGFKVASDYAVAALLLASLATLYRVRACFERQVLTLLSFSIVFSIASELAFNLYVDYYSYNNLVGHYLKIVSFFLLYKAVIATGLFRPYDILFRDLKRSEEALRAARDELETRVTERTSDLVRVKGLLESELAEKDRIAKEREVVLNLLGIIDSAESVQRVMNDLIVFLSRWVGCDAVGIRLRSGFDYPYVETIGFPEGFVAAESCLQSVDRDGEMVRDEEGRPVYECLCGEVICGRLEFSATAATPSGSFWTNNAPRSFSEAAQAGRPVKVRGRCLLEGYKSVALVPLRIGKETIGLIQFNDRRAEFFSAEMVAQFKWVGNSIAAGLGKLLSEEALKESEDRFRSLVENLLVGVMIVRDGRVVFRNIKQEHLVGPIPEVFDFRSFGRIHPEDLPKFENLYYAMMRESNLRQELDLRFVIDRGDPGREEIRWVHCQTSPIEFQGREAILINMVDITRTKDLEHIMMDRERLASLGHLAAGIAHEIRNPLSGINLNLSTLENLCAQAGEMPEEDRERIAEVIGKAKIASNKIASVIRSVMDFSKPVPPRPGRVNMNRVIEKAVDFSSVFLRKHGVELQTALDPGLPDCHADPRLMEQVLVNMITNATQAMEGVDGPKRIEISSSREGERIVTRVSDSGPGIPPHLQERIFDPFYTTRKDGYGIGLSFSHRVVSEHGGKLTLATSKWGGAEFRIGLPSEPGRADA